MGPPPVPGGVGRGRARRPPDRPQGRVRGPASHQRRARGPASQTERSLRRERMALGGGFRQLELGRGLQSRHQRNRRLVVRLCVTAGRDRLDFRTGTDRASAGVHATESGSKTSNSIHFPVNKCFFFFYSKKKLKKKKKKKKKKK